MEEGLNAKGYSESNEKRILDALGRGLLREFPNPERVGCPDADVLERIASHEMPLSEAEKWLEHLGSCSPCYADFKRFREALEWRRRRTWLAAAAGILLAITIAGWALLHRRNENLIAHTAVLDLRDRSIARGAEPNDRERPLEIARNVSELEIYLPLGSGEGLYDVMIVASSGRPILSASGRAKLKDHITSLSVSGIIGSAQPGRYILRIRKSGEQWNSYMLELH